MSLPVCRFYITNQVCRFGRNCRFLHPDRPTDVDDSQSPSSSGYTFQNEVSVNKGGSTLPDVVSSSKGLAFEDQKDESVNEVSHQLEASHICEDTILEPEESKSATIEKSRKKKQHPPKNNRPICIYYARSKKCNYGNNCRFSHDVQAKPQSRGSYQVRHNAPKSNLPPRLQTKKSEENENVEVSEELSSELNKNLAQNETLNYIATNQLLEPVAQQIDKGRVQKRERICPFFKSNRCNRGERCRFRHPSDIVKCIAKNDENLSGQRISTETENKTHRPVSVRQQSNPEVQICRNRRANNYGVRSNVLTLTEIDEAEINKLRQSEINVIQKRFPKDRITVVEDSETNFTVHIKFMPSDPDWPFDVKLFEIQVTIPAKYPVEMLKVCLPRDQDLPETVRRYIDITIGEWLEEKKQKLQSAKQVELIFRPFLKWLDRSIEEITTDALKQLKRELVARAAGVQIFSPQQLQEKLKTHSDESGEDSSGGSDESDTEDDNTDSSSESDEGQNCSKVSNLDPDKKGTEVELRHIQLKDNASALMFDRLKVVIQCLRCKDHSDLLVPQARVVSTRCGKCNQRQFVNFRPALIHQFSSVLGYLDLDGCHVFDLVLPDCRAFVTCMGCSKQSKIEGLVSGQMINGWCQACNAKFKLAIESVKLTQLMPSGVDTSVHKVIEVAAVKSKKPPKNPAIREGCPLPEFGTCRHYKHSYRWLRFPCCGKAYPCDVCHDKKENHEMTFANRMICGHCCKEQHFSPLRPCTSCGQHMTKIRSSHWEGGQGCRDKIAMGRNDPQKFRNQNKTISSHKKKTQSSGGKGKQNIKLRHS